MNHNVKKFIGREQAKGDNTETNQKELSDQEAVELKHRFADALVRKVNERIVSDEK